MKCIIAVILAIAVASEASVLPWGYAGHPAATVVQANAPYLHGAWGAPWGAAHLGAPWGAAHWGAPWGAAHWGAPAAVVAAHHAHPHAAVVSAHHASAVPGATSVTATRGSVHVAPLAGHAVSQQQLNLAPAPGTI